MPLQAGMRGQKKGGEKGIKGTKSESIAKDNKREKRRE